MAIWTSRYSNKELVENKDKYYCVGISLGTPKFPLGYTVEQQCYSLAPKGYMLRMELEKFTEEYYRKLEGIGNDKIINMVMIRGNGGGQRQRIGFPVLRGCKNTGRLVPQNSIRSVVLRTDRRNHQGTAGPKSAKSKETACTEAGKERRKQAHSRSEGSQDGNGRL